MPAITLKPARNTDTRSWVRVDKGTGLRSVITELEVFQRAFIAGDYKDATATRAAMATATEQSPVKSRFAAYFPA